MNQILLLLAHKENRRLLADLLSRRYQVFVPGSDCEAEPFTKLCKEKLLQEFSQPFDLCILDGPALDRFEKWVKAKRKAEKPVFLPFLLITPRQDVSMVTHHLWESVDELLVQPIKKQELQARVEILLRLRQLSLELQINNQQLHKEIAERQRAESELRQSEAKFRSLIQNSSDIITILETDGTIRYESPSIHSNLGFYPAEVEETNFYSFIHPDDLLVALAHFQQVLKPPFNLQVSECRFHHKDGSWRYLESKSHFIEENLDGIIVNSRDITERKQAEELINQALKQAKELLDLKGRFVSMVSHEIRTPLSIILISAQTLQNYGEKWPTEKKQQVFIRLQKGVKRIEKMLKDVLLIGKGEVEKQDFNPIQLDLAKYCGDLVEEILFADSNKHTITFVTQCLCTKAYADKKLLGHILTNLLSNAVKYSPEGSMIDFELSCQDEKAIFEIRDKGIGIPPEEQDKLFESFYRATNATNIQGTGLGLAIVKQSVDKHGGTISINSELGVGTTFTVSLPIGKPTDVS